jgi:hypothetical protein
MESNERYYARRAGEEARAADRALTPVAKARHRELAVAFQLKAGQCRRERQAGQRPSSRPRETGSPAAEPSQTLTAA